MCTVLSQSTINFKITAKKKKQSCKKPITVFVEFHLFVDLTDILVSFCVFITVFKRD